MASVTRGLGGHSAGSPESSTLRDIDEIGGWKGEIGDGNGGLRSPGEMGSSSGFVPRAGRPRSFTEETKSGSAKIMKKARKWSSGVVNKLF